MPELGISLISYYRKFMRQLNFAIFKGDISRHLIFAILENLNLNRVT